MARNHNPTCALASAPASAWRDGRQGPRLDPKVVLIQRTGSSCGRVRLTWCTAIARTWRDVVEVCERRVAHLPAGVASSCVNAAASIVARRGPSQRARPLLRENKTELPSSRINWNFGLFSPRALPGMDSSSLQVNRSLSFRVGLKWSVQEPALQTL